MSFHLERSVKLIGRTHLQAVPFSSHPSTCLCPKTSRFLYHVQNVVFVGLFSWVLWRYDRLCCGDREETDSGADSCPTEIQWVHFYLTDMIQWQVLWWCAIAFQETGGRRRERLGEVVGLMGHKGFFHPKWFSLVKPWKVFHVLAKKLDSNPTKTTFITFFKMSWSTCKIQLHISFNVLLYY